MRQRYLLQFFDSFSESLRFHIISVATESRMPPGSIFGLRKHFPPAAKIFYVDIPKTGLRQRNFECFFIKMWKPARTRETPHISHDFNLEGFEHFNKLFQATRGMPDRPNTPMLLIRIHLMKNEDYRSRRDSQL